MGHNSLVVVRHNIKSFLDHMATKGVHAQTQSIATDGIADGEHLFWSPMFEAALDEEIPETVDHQRVGLGYDCLDYIELLLRSPYLELLLEEDRGLLIVIARDFVNDVFPVAGHIAV